MLAGIGTLLNESSLITMVAAGSMDQFPPLTLDKELSLFDWPNHILLYAIKSSRKNKLFLLNFYHPP